MNKYTSFRAPLATPKSVTTDNCKMSPGEATRAAEIVQELLIERVALACTMNAIDQALSDPTRLDFATHIVAGYLDGWLTQRQRPVWLKRGMKND